MNNLKMNNLNLSFRAQSLDNQSPDPVEVNNQCLTKEDVSERQELAKKISKVALDGTQVFSEGTHTASLHGNKFILKMPSDQLDNADRVAPILCYGHVPDEQPPASWSGGVVNAMVGFAGRIGRTISPESQKVARRGVEAILEATQRKKQLKRRRRMLWLTLLIALGVLGILWVIFFKK